MIRLASKSEFEPATEREHQARVRAAEIVAALSAARAAITAFEQTWLSSGEVAAQGHVSDLTRATDVLRVPAPNAIDTLQPITAQVRGLNPEAWR